MSAARLSLAAALLAACGSSRPAADTSTAEVKGEPADAGVSLGRPSASGDAGPELPPTVVKSSVLETHRLSGTPTIEPDADDRTPPAGKTSVAAAVKLCVDGAGKVAGVKLLRSSGLPRYDDKILRETRTWTYRPVMGEGQPVDVCTVMTFVFRFPLPTTPAPSSP